jgi:hypothetical protein
VISDRRSPDGYVAWEPGPWSFQAHSGKNIFIFLRRWRLGRRHYPANANKKSAYAPLDFTFAFLGGYSDPRWLGSGSLELHVRRSIHGMHVKKLIVISVILIAGAIYGITVSNTFRRYQLLAGELNQMVYILESFDKIEFAVGEYVSEPSPITGVAEKLISAGYSQGLRGMYDAMNYTMPRFNWMNMRENKAAIVRGMLKGTLAPIAVNRTIYYKKNR